MAVPLLDLQLQYAHIQPEIEAAVLDVLRSQSFILGPRVERFERAIAQRLGARHAVGVSSGTDALLLSLMAAGVGPGHEVVTTPFTFFATAGAILRVGARPVFVDIEANSFNVDVRQIEAVLTPDTRAILPVHLFGRMANMPALRELSRARGIALIEDAAQCIGARSPHGAAGAIGDYGCFSFFPSKNLGGAGDGGLVTCATEEQAMRVKRLRAHGAVRPHEHEGIGGNFRLDALQAAILEVKLAHLEEWTRARRDNAHRYRSLFQKTGLVAVHGAAPNEKTPVALPHDSADHVYNQFVIRAHRRDALAKALSEKRIGCAVYYPRPLHLQPALAFLGYAKNAFAEAERASREVLALPIYPELSDAQADEVVTAVATFYA